MEVLEETLVVNLKQSAEATVVVVFPPPERKKRSHKEGKKVLVDVEGDNGADEE